MSDGPAYRFKCMIVDETNDMLIISDHTYVGQIDQFGGCESVDVTVARMMRQFKQSAKTQHEAKL